MAYRFGRHRGDIGCYHYLLVAAIEKDTITVGRQQKIKDEGDLPHTTVTVYTRSSRVHHVGLHV